MFKKVVALLCICAMSLSMTSFSASAEEETPAPSSTPVVEPSETTQPEESATPSVTPTTDTQEEVSEEVAQETPSTTQEETHVRKTRSVTNPQVDEIHIQTKEQLIDLMGLLYVDNYTVDHNTIQESKKIILDNDIVVDACELIDENGYIKAFNLKNSEFDGKSKTITITDNKNIGSYALFQSIDRIGDAPEDLHCGVHDLKLSYSKNVIGAPFAYFITDESQPTPKSQGPCLEIKKISVSVNGDITPINFYGESFYGGKGTYYLASGFAVTIREDGYEAPNDNLISIDIRDIVVQVNNILVRKNQNTEYFYCALASGFVCGIAHGDNYYNGMPVINFSKININANKIYNDLNFNSEPSWFQLSGAVGFVADELYGERYSRKSNTTYDIEQFRITKNINKPCTPPRSSNGGSPAYYPDAVKLSDITINVDGIYSVMRAAGFAASLDHLTLSNSNIHIKEIIAASSLEWESNKVIAHKESEKLPYKPEMGIGGISVDYSTTGDGVIDHLTLQVDRMKVLASNVEEARVIGVSCGAYGRAPKISNSNITLGNLELTGTENGTIRMLVINSDSAKNNTFTVNDMVVNSESDKNYMHISDRFTGFENMFHVNHRMQLNIQSEKIEYNGLNFAPFTTTIYGKEFAKNYVDIDTLGINSNAEGKYDISGFIDKNYSKLTDCGTTIKNMNIAIQPKESNNSKLNVGGFISKTSNSDNPITNCSATILNNMTIKTNVSSYIGGFIGNTTTGTFDGKSLISNCSSQIGDSIDVSEVTSVDLAVGGFVGLDIGTGLDHCTALIFNEIKIQKSDKRARLYGGFAGAISNRLSVEGQGQTLFNANIKGCANYLGNPTILNVSKNDSKQNFIDPSGLQVNYFASEVDAIDILSHTCIANSIAFKKLKEHPDLFMNSFVDRAMLVESELPNENGETVQKNNIYAVLAEDGKRTVYTTRIVPNKVTGEEGRQKAIDVLIDANSNFKTATIKGRKFQNQYWGSTADKDAIKNYPLKNPYWESDLELKPFGPNVDVVKDKEIQLEDFYQRHAAMEKDGVVYDILGIPGEPFPDTPQPEPTNPPVVIGDCNDCIIVHFETYGGTKIPDQIIQAGSLATRPQDPVKEGYEFVGWYYYASDEYKLGPRTADLLKPFSFSRRIYDSITLYAKWKKIAVEEKKPVPHTADGEI